MFRHAKGEVQVVDFRRYVAVVMASEWPDYLPMAAIEAGAMAVKQYGWSKVLAGRHRPGYVTASGKCYDVTDRTRDQLFRPEARTPGSKVKQAVDKTWSLSLRKNGKFFQTGYRRGSNVGCGRDADGWKLYARSVIKCANQGLSREEIQFIYYGKNLTIHSANGNTVKGGGGGQPPKEKSKPKPTPKATPKPKPTPKAAPKPTVERKPATAPKRKRSPRPQPQPSPSTEQATSEPLEALLDALATSSGPLVAPEPTAMPIYAPRLAEWAWAPGDTPVDLIVDSHAMSPPAPLADAPTDADVASDEEAVRDSTGLTEATF